MWISADAHSLCPHSDHHEVDLSSGPLTLRAIHKKNKTEEKKRKKKMDKEDKIII